MVNLKACANVQKRIAERFNADNKNLDLSSIKTDFADFEKNVAGEHFRGVSNTTLDMVNAGTKGTGGDVKIVRDEDFNRILGECMAAPAAQFIMGNQGGMGMMGAPMPMKSQGYVQ